MKTALVTGAHGFLGRNVTAIFSQAGYEVHGIGIGTWSGEVPADFGIRSWHETSISLDTLETMKCNPDVVVHCAGSGSVGFSLGHPYEDFSMTVDTTAAVLEYLRTSAPQAKLIYPSSAAVYGGGHQGPIGEEAPLAPASPYGVHKMIAEQLCLSAVRNAGLRCAIVRFFSLYGPGLRKQLLWDACARLVAPGEPSVEFFGTGAETRDWLHVRDAARLMLAASDADGDALVMNGGSGRASSVGSALEKLRDALGSAAAVCFNGEVREGDPVHLEADTQRALALGWLPSVSLEEGIREYAAWFRSMPR